MKSLFTSVAQFLWITLYIEKKLPRWKSRIHARIYNYDYLYIFNEISRFSLISLILFILLENSVITLFFSLKNPTKLDAARKKILIRSKVMNKKRLYLWLLNKQSFKDFFLLISRRSTTSKYFLLLTSHVCKTWSREVC